MGHHPQAPFKYVRNYLALSFDIQTRAAILANHYEYLADLVVMDFTDRICRGAISLWQEEIAEQRYSIDLSYPGNEEGELFLVFSENAEPLYTVIFTIASGKSLDVTDDQLIFIGRMQGVAHKREALKRASKSFEELIPAALLLSAIRAIAETLDISGIVGVSARNQVCKYGSRFPAVAASAYDEFWISSGGVKLNEQFYYLPVPQTEKPLSEIKNNHRSRVKRKRQVKYSLMEQVSLTFRRQCLAPAKL